MGPIHHPWKSVSIRRFLRPLRFPRRRILNTMNPRALLPVASLALLTAGLASRPAVVPPPKEPIEFNRDIRPILDKCSQCHGPTTGPGFAGLRLDSFEGATKTLPSGRKAIIPGDPVKSALMRRVGIGGAGVVLPADSD